MNIVLIRPVDDPDIIELFVVQFETNNPMAAATKGTMEAFEIQWDQYLNLEKSKKPETWSVGQVIKCMEKQGWQFMRVNNSTTVTY